MLVHVPISLALIWPLVDLAGLISRRPDVSATGLGLLGLAVPASLAASVTGQAAYDVALARGVGGQILDGHAEYAELLPWFLILVLLVRTLGVKKFGPRARFVAVALGLAIGGFVVLIGSTGGDLVFTHGVGVAQR